MDGGWFRHSRVDQPTEATPRPGDAGTGTAWLAGDDADARDRLQRLLRQASPDFGGRTALLTCPICGDLACGAFTAEIVFGESLVTWCALGYDGGSRTEPPAFFEPPLQLQFDRDSYSEMLQTALKALGG